MNKEEEFGIEVKLQSQPKRRENKNNFECSPSRAPATRSNRAFPMAAGGGGRPIRALNVAEKPSVARQVASILSKNPSSGGMRTREGRSRYNKIFEFNCVINNQLFQMSFTSVTGHLMELEFDERYRKWHSCDPADLYSAPVRKYVPQVTY